MVNYEKKRFCTLCILFIFGVYCGMLCTNLLQTPGTNISRNNSIHREQPIDKPTITKQSNRVEGTTKNIESGSFKIERANQNIKRTANSIGELLQEQRRLLNAGKQNLETAIRVNEEKK